ncbi:hypothetical protein [Bradyrhizobium elkanii]|uniref:hypothetical protein n=1 Tax=Bradyrhizobium elkanii TaxID=29448 RepID=UPI001BABF383|nr:hypothetical protein [Bradyrhizobium elkanii]MBR1164236.1 hypothetical protein [Bradyrhizobium elkanii]
MIVNIPLQHRDERDCWEDTLARLGCALVPMAMATRLDEIEADLAAGRSLSDADHDDIEAIATFIYTGPVGEYHQRKVYA